MGITIHSTVSEAELEAERKEWLRKRNKGWAGDSKNSTTAKKSAEPARSKKK